MKKIIYHNKLAEWITIITLSFVIATINIIHVIIGFAKTPKGFTYLATGHYYLDYFEYLQYVSTGIAGRWMPMNYFTTDVSPVDWRFFPYVLLGKFALFFQFSPILAYWISVFFLTVFTLLGFYYLIRTMLKNESFYLRIIAFLIAVFAGPVYRIVFINDQLILNPYDFWYGPASFIRRFELVPYHTLGLFLLIIIVVTINKFWTKIPHFSNIGMIANGLYVTILLVILMTFSPLSLASLIPALMIMNVLYFIKFKRDRLKIFLFNSVLLLLIPAAIILRQSPGYGGWSLEVNWMAREPWWFVLLNLGPIIFFFPFGIVEYLREDNFLRKILFLFSLISYGLFFSPVAYYLGTHNLRFFSSISYVFYGVLTVLGIKKVSSLFNNKSKIVMILLSSLLIFYSCFLTFYSLSNRAKGLDSSTPVTIWTYLPNEIIEGLRSLQDYPKGNVLTGPYGGIGMFVPIFSYKRVYVGHPSKILMPNIEEKRSINYRFYGGIMTEKEVNKFIKENNIRYVVLTSFDNFNINNIKRYSFLKPILIKKSIIIWKVSN